MGDLKTNWTDPALGNEPDMSGQGVVSRGSDPNASGGDGAAGLKEFWPGDKQALANIGTEESSNSVSGLPALPNRFEPSESSVSIPDLKDRRPGTIKG